MAAALVARARREVIDRFMAVNAVSPDLAITYQPDRRLQRRTFERYQARGVIRAASKNRWYLDAPTYAAHTKRRRRSALAGLAGAHAMLGTALLAH